MTEARGTYLVEVCVSEEDGWTGHHVWCDFDRASSLICGNKMPTRCNRVFFIADLIACSTCFGHHYAHHQELKSIIQWLLPVVFRAVNQHPANRTHNPQLHTRPATWKTTARNTTGSNHCIILLSSWWWARWCPKHVEQAIRSAIKTSVASSWHFISTYSTLFHLGEFNFYFYGSNISPICLNFRLKLDQLFPDRQKDCEMYGTTKH